MDNIINLKNALIRNETALLVRWTGQDKVSQKYDHARRLIQYIDSCNQAKPVRAARSRKAAVNE